MARTAIGRAFALAALIALALGSTAAAHNGSSLASAQDETPSGWLGAVRSAETFRRQAGDAGIHVKERAEFSALWNGVSVEATPSDVSALRTLDGVTAVYPNVVASVPPADLAVAARRRRPARRSRAASSASTAPASGSGSSTPASTGSTRTSAAASVPAAASRSAGTSSGTPTTRTRPARPTARFPFRTPIPTTATAMARTSPASSARAAG